ncbi:MAG: glycosyltransferase family 4 protein [Anaerolineae bacterium]
MRVLMLSTYDRLGGAAIAARRLHDGLRAAGVDSLMLVHEKTDPDASVISAYSRLNTVERFRLSQSIRRHGAALGRYPERTTADWSINRWENGLRTAIESLQPDILHLHWVGNGYMPLQTLSRIRVPVVWTLHDMWAFTGGCHYTDGCEQYTDSCGCCPQLASDTVRDLSRSGWMLRQRHLPVERLTVASPSRWLADCARKSSLLAKAVIDVIPNGLSLDRFRPFDRSLARSVFGLPHDTPIILFGAVNSTSTPRKGYVYLKQMLLDLPAGVHTVVFGTFDGLDLPSSTTSVGVLRDEHTMALLYAAADVFVAPSTQDNLPNTVMEALACGTPVVAFRIGGMPDLITHGQTGYLAQPFDTTDLAAGVTACLENPSWGQAGRRDAEARYGIDHAARRYLELYRSLLP